MIKNYDKYEYARKAEEANNLGKKLYIVETTQEFEKQVFEYEKKEVEVPIYNEDGEIIGYEIILVDDLDKPIMVEEINPETGEKILVHKYHIEYYTDVVASLIIADDGYYICTKDNITDGTVNPNYEEEKAEKEKEHIKSLTCTKRVFALMLKELGVDYRQLKELIASNEDAQLEWDLCVELLRNNPLLDLMGRQLGLSPEQLDKLFQYANGEITIEEFKGNE